MKHINTICKEILTTKEVCDYAGFSKSQLYKLTSRREIQFFRPTGKLLYFRKQDIDNFLLSKRFEAYNSLTINLPILNGGYNG